MRIMGKDNVNMLSGPITKGLLAMTMPIMVMSLLSSLFNVVDMTALKMFGFARAVGAVGACSTLITLCTSLLTGTSIGANIHEANYASSKADFVAKMQIALKECHENEYWLKLFVKTNIINESIYTKLNNDSGKIRRILISSINTAKANL